MPSVNDLVDMLVKRICQLTRTADTTDLTDGEFVAVDKTDAYTRKMTVGNLATWVLGRIKSLSTTITAFRTGDVIPVDGPSGTAKMTKDDLLKETAQNAFAVSSKVVLLVSYKVAPDTLDEGFSYISSDSHIVTKKNGLLVYSNPSKKDFYYYNDKLYTWDGYQLVPKADAYLVDRIVNASSLATDVVGNYIVIATNGTTSLVTRIAAGDPAGVIWQSMDKSKAYIYNGTCYTWDGSRLVPQCNYVEENLDKYFLDGTYYDTSGASIDFNFSSNANFCGCVIRTKAGDIFKISSVGGSAPRAFAIVNNDGTIALASSASATISNLYIFIKDDGFLVVNSTKVGTHHITRTRLREAKENAEFGYNVGVNKFFSINVAGNVGDTPTLEIGTGRQWAHDVYDVSAGDEFLISGMGGGGAKLFCFVNTDGEIALASPATFDATTNEIIVSAPCDGKLYVNALRMGYGFYIKTKKTASEQTADNFKKSICSYALADFEHSPDMFNYVGGALDGITFDSTCMESIYVKFEQLIADAPHNVTKVDAYTFTGVTPPDYATYDTWMYKISWDNWDTQADRIGLNSLHKKRKMLILGGVHGEERGAQANCYIFAENLVKCKNKDYFNLLSSYDIYIVPVVNGWGSINNTRTNGNGVNINRNYPTDRWTLLPIGPDYSGLSAGSEAETKMVVKLLELIDPAIAIDHHNYYGGNQFYCVPFSFVAAREAYKALEDISFASIKNYPQYFGSNYQLIVNRSSPLNACLIEYGKATFPDYCRYAPNPSLSLAATVEMNGCISFNGGEPSGNIGGYGTEATTAVGEYMLRAFALRYAEYDLNKTAEIINEGYIPKI